LDLKSKNSMKTLCTDLDCVLPAPFHFDNNNNNNNNNNGSEKSPSARHQNIQTGLPNSSGSGNRNGDVKSKL